MVRLKKLTISGFRGARYPLTLEFTGSCKSIAIFGENASGKSTITDAIEWFFKGKVDHLWREDCKEEALRHVQMGEKENALVSLEFSDKQFSSMKQLTTALAIVDSNTSAAFKDYRAKATDERLVLRTAYLTKFIDKSKGEKRKELADIIGYEALIEFRSHLLAAFNSLEKNPDYIYAKKNQAVAQGKLMKLTGRLLAHEAELFAAASELVSRFSPEARITDEKGYMECIDELKGKISQQTKVEKRLKLEELKKACGALIRGLRAVGESEDQFLLPYDRLVRNKEKVKLLDIEQFLSKGKDVLDKDLAERDLCPFCGSKIDLDHLKREVAKRIDELAFIRKEFQATKDAKEQWVSDLRQVNRLAGELERTWAGLDVIPELAGLVRKTAGDILLLVSSVEERFRRYQGIQKDEEGTETIRQLVNNLEARIRKADEEAKGLELTKEELVIVDLIQTLNELRSAFSDYRQNTKAKERFERQIRTLAKSREEFIKIQNAAFQNVLDLMSDNISKYYLFLHPPKNENVDDVKLRIVGEEGIEFEYSFLGRKTYPPMKYLSESHLNSLGLALFLASVQLFNEKSNFFVLDDVVTSFDAGHRIRLLRLLQEEFSEWQILLLTHERHWFEIIKKELASAGWLIREVDWSLENGVQLREAPEDLRELIKLKQSLGHGVANDVRTLLETVLKEICHGLHVKMAFQYNDRNEERMPGELLSELRRTINEKAPAIKDHPIFKQIETSNFLGTKGSHDRLKEISKGDIDVALEDIDKLESLFRCGQCGQLVSRERFNEPEKKITCKCGEKAIDWKP